MPQDNNKLLLNVAVIILGDEMKGWCILCNPTLSVL